MFKIKWTAGSKEGLYTTDKGVKIYKTEKAAKAAAERFQRMAPEVKYEVIK